MIMGCYGIGVSRIAAASIEQSHDEKGIVWPKSIAPFDISIIAIGYTKNDTIKTYSDNLYNMLKNINIEVLLDDRDVRPGNMFSDSDLIGIPNKIIIGKQFLEKQSLELKNRKKEKSHIINENKISEKPSLETIKAISDLINR
tara:strand:- start:233 stop:661 length:429 start_codon:yes stop_codon:yes gene_type:complete